MPTLNAEAFARAFGTTPDEIQRTCGDLLASLDFSFAPVAGEARDRLLLQVLRRIEGDTQIVGAPERQEVWEAGWREALEAFIAAGDDLEALVPRFIRRGQPVRLDQAYVQPVSSTFELDFVRVLRQWLFRTFMAKADAVYEFGCGTGFNLVALAQLFPEKRLHGLDFVPASVELVTRIAATHGLRLQGHAFDMSKPDPDFRLEPGSAVLTFGALEQLAGRIQPFLDYLCDQPIALCVHVEPVPEFYDPEHLVDHLALRFQAKRGYTPDLHARLEAMRLEGRIAWIARKRTGFGSLLMEGYNLLVWRPVR